MKQYNSTTLVRTIWSLLLVISALCLIPTTAEAQLSVRSRTRATIKGFHGGTGQVRLTLSRGKAPYTVKLTAYPEEYRGQQTTFTSQKEETIIYNLPKGRYTLEVSDANGSVETVSSSVREVGVGLNDFWVNAKWSQLHTSETNPSRWLSTRIFDPDNSIVPYYYSSEIDSIAKYFDIAICVSDDYYNGYEKGRKDLNWLDLKEAKTAPTFEGTYGCWLVQDPVYDDNGKPTGQTVERSHLFVKVPDDSPSPDELYYNSRFALPFGDKEKIGIAIRVKGSSDPKNSDYSNAQYLFDAKKSADPNPWIEMVGEGKDDPCEYKPTFALKKDVVEKMNLQFPVKVKCSSGTEITFTDRNDTTPKDLGALDYNSYTWIYMRDASGKESSMGFRTGKPIGPYAEKFLGYLRYYSDTDPARIWDETEGWQHDPKSGGPSTRDYCTGEVKMVLALTLQEKHFDKAFKTPFADAQITLEAAPPGYKPLNKYFPKIGEPINVPAKHLSALFFPFPSESAPEDNPYEKPYFDVHVPDGNYYFTVSFHTICGDPEDESVRVQHNSFSRKYELVNQGEDLKPQFEKVDCKTIRVYPFRGAKSREILLLNGKAVRVYARAAQTAPNAYGTVASGSVYFDPERSSQSPEDCYIELPWRNSTVTIQYNYESISPRTKIIPCLNIVKKITVETTAPSYDGYQLYTYICPNGSKAYVSVLPIRTAGETLIELRDVKDINKIYASKTLPSKDQGKSVSFDLTGDNIQTKYRLYIRTGSDQCVLDNGGEIIKMSDFRGFSFVKGATNTKYCEGDTIKLECPPILPKSTYTWTRPDGKHETGRKIAIPHAPRTLSGVWTLEVSGIPCEDSEAVQTVSFPLSVAPPELWWSEKAKSADWNSFENWADKDGKPANAIPAKCTDVHLPAVVEKFYPNLDPKKTIREPFGEPLCNDIYFHFGSALGEPQRLTHYSRAFIDYNFGIVQSDGTIKAHEDSKHPGAYDRILSRDEWHLLSTPIKNVYAGDFALGGYPLTYQCYLKVKDLMDFRKIFERPINKLGCLIAAYNYALAFKVEGYHPEKLGAKDHTNLNGLKGIIRLPFYENKELAPYYPLHRYYKNWYWYTYDEDKKEGKVTAVRPEPASYFAYFDLNTLKAVCKVDSVKRYPALDYRFLFEDDKTNAIGTTVDANGNQVEGYTLRVSRPAVSDNRFTLVGNPFMCPIDYERLFNANKKNNLRPGLYIYADGAWRLASKRGSTMRAKRDKEFDAIAPLQAFVIFLKSENPNQTLYFPTAPAEISVLRDPNTSKFELRSTDEELEELEELSERYVAVTVTDERGGYASAELLPENREESMPALFASESMQTAPLVYFISPTDSTCNFVQTNVPSAVVELGVFAPTDGMLTLDFTTLAEKPFDKLSLYDRLRGTEQDLLVNPTYTYGYSERDGRRFELRMSYGNVRYDEQQDHQPDLAIERTATGYRISYDQGIAGYQLYSVHGYLLERATTDGQTQVDIEMPETEVVLLDVQSADGLRWIKKLQR